MENRELFEKVIRDDIDDLEKEKQKLKKKMDKILDNFNSNDIQKLNKTVSEIEKNQAIQKHLYLILNTLDIRIRVIQ